MSGRDVERDLSDFFRNTAPPEPSVRLREALTAARHEPAGRRVGAMRRPGLALSLAGLAASIVLAVGLLVMVANRGVRYGVGGASPTPTTGESASAGPGESPSETPIASLGESPSAGLGASPGASPSPSVVPSPTRDAAVTFGPAGIFKAIAPTEINPTMSELLPDGRVLLVGGDISGNAAELYDPATGKFMAIGPAAEYHWRGTLTRLSDGRALVVGGFGLSDQLATAEIYDPATGKFTPTGSLAAPRFDFSAARLQNGQVLVVGGSRWTDTNGTTIYLQSAEIYDPASGRFHPAGDMTVARNKPSVVTLQDGRVLIAGGQSKQAYGSLASAEIYDPATGKFTATGSMTMSRGVGVGTLLQDGRVLIFGGDDDMMGVQYADLYDPSTGTFSKTGPEVIDRVGHTATLLADGRVLIAGGIAGPGGVASVDLSIFAMTESRYLSAAELYDPIKGTFTRIGNMTTPRVDFTATLLLDGRVLIAGGDLREPRDRAELYVP